MSIDFDHDQVSSIRASATTTCQRIVADYSSLIFLIEAIGTLVAIFPSLVSKVYIDGFGFLAVYKQHVVSTLVAKAFELIPNQLSNKVFLPSRPLQVSHWRRLSRLLEVSGW